VASTPTRKQVLTDLRRNEILSAAIKLFGRQGFHDTCVEDIASAAKIAKGTLYLYFKSKEDIYTTAIHQAVTELQRLSAERTAAAHGVRDRLSVAIAVRMSYWTEQLGLYRLLLTVGREQTHRRQTNELLRAGHAAFHDILTEAHAAGELPIATSAASLSSTAWAILDMVRGCNERRLDKLSTTTPEQDAATITTIAFQHLGL
jgi:AcrR family transcriptional regulator